MILSFMMEKGGTGKSTLAFNTAWELARTEKVLLIDADPQRGNITRICGIPKTEDLLTLYDVMENNISIRKCIQSVNDNLDMVPADYRLSWIDNAEQSSVKKLKAAINSVSKQYSTIIIDCTPFPGVLQYLVLAVSNYVVSPIVADQFATEGMIALYETLSDVKEDGYKPKLLGFVFNKYSARGRVIQSSVEEVLEVAEKINADIFNTRIRQGVTVSEIVNEHRGVCDYAKRSPVADDIRQFVNELKERMQ